MSISLQCEDFLLTGQEVGSLWEQVCEHRRFGDEVVTVRCVSAKKIAALNKQYRGKGEVTNVLTFSYDGEHDVVLCLSVAERESQEREMDYRHYVALLLVHAFLHATGMDHERSDEEAGEMSTSEQVILRRAGFVASSL